MSYRETIIDYADERLPAHSEAFREAACSRKGLDSIALGAKALALTALRLIESPELLAGIRAEHARQVQAQQRT